MKYINISNFDLKNVVNIASMFQGCIRLIEIYFNNDILTENLEDMNSMFYRCESLEYINTKIFKVNKVTNLSYTFAECDELQELNLSNFETENVLDLRYAFHDCYKLKIIDLSNFDTSKVTQMDNMFSNCALRILDISNFHFENVVDSSFMFQECTHLEKIKFNDNTTTENLEIMSNMFEA